MKVLCNDNVTIPSEQTSERIEVNIRTWILLRQITTINNDYTK